MWNVEDATLIERLRRWWKNQRLSRKVERMNRHRARIQAEVNTRIQVMEFDKTLCIAIDGIPVYPIGNFELDQLECARATLFKYLYDIR